MNLFFSFQAQTRDWLVSCNDDAAQLNYGFLRIYKFIMFKAVLQSGGGSRGFKL